MNKSKSIERLLYLISFTLMILCSYASNINEEKGISVTIYNNNFAMVKDVRSITFDKGNSFVYFTDVAENIQTETVTFKPIPSKDDTRANSISSKIRVYEQNFERNLINKNSILEKYLQKQVKLTVSLGKNSRVVRGKLLGFNDGYIVQTENGIDVFNFIDSIEFSQLPDGFFTKPTLNWKVYSEEDITTDCEVAYRTTGFSWKADYSLTIDENEKKVDIGGWVTIDNNSGKKYVEAKLKLIAGDVNVVRPVSPPSIRRKGLPQAKAMAMNVAPQFSQKSFADYHMYTLSQPVTLNQSSQKQVQFIPKVYDVAIRKFYSIPINTASYSQDSIKAQNKIQFQNSKQIGLGIPFPKGTVRVFKRDKQDGSLEFVGQDSIDHTPKNEKISITTGTAFDIVSKLQQLSRKDYQKGGYKSQMRLTIKNHKQTDAQIQVSLNNYYGNNLQLNWTNILGAELTKQHANKYKVVIKKLQAQKQIILSWGQDYRP